MERGNKGNNRTRQTHKQSTKFKEAAIRIVQVIDLITISRRTQFFELKFKKHFSLLHQILVGGGKVWFSWFPSIIV